MKTLTSKPATIILGVIIAIVIAFSYQSALASLKMEKSVEPLGDLPIGTFGAPTHLTQIR